MKSLLRSTIAALLTALCALFVAQTCWCFDNEPDRFRGIRWGTDIEDTQTMVPVKDVGSYSYYLRLNDTMKMAGTNLAAVRYGFYEGKFSSVLIGLASREDFEALRKVFFDHYGKGFGPEGTMQEEYHWFGAAVAISMYYDDKTGKGTISYIHRPAERQREAEIMPGTGGAGQEFP